MIKRGERESEWQFRVVSIKRIHNYSGEFGERGRQVNGLKSRGAIT